MPLRRAAALSLAALAVAAGAWLSACSAPNPVLTFFFEGVPAAGVPAVPLPAKAPRRAPYKPPPPDVILVDAPVLKPAIDWRARYAALPRSDEEEVQWVKALDEKLVEPKPGIAADAKDYDTTDDDLEYIPKSKPKYKVLFRHEPHTKWLRCDNCHPAIFARRQGRAQMSMEKLEEGLFCGVCHLKVAAPQLENCAPCHPK